MDTGQNVERREKKRSIRNISLAAILAAGLIIGVTVLASQIASFRTMTRQLTESSQLIIDIYKNNLTEAVRKSRAFGEDLAYSDENVRMMAVSTLPSVQYYELEYKLRNSMQSYLSSDGDIYSFQIIDRNRNHIISCYRTSDGSNYDLEQTLKREVLLEDTPKPAPFIYTLGEDHYLVQVFSRGSIRVYSLIRLSDYAYRDVDWLRQSGSAFVAFEFDDTLYENRELLSEYGLDIEDLHQNSRPNLFQNYFIYSEEITGTDLDMHLVATSRSLRALIRFSMISILISFFVILMMMLFVYRQFRVLMIYPVSRIGTRIDRISRGETAESSESDVTEFQLIDRSIDDLVNVMSDLKNQYYEEQMKHQELMLQYYQLQTEPHFFLNCLKNISSMAEDGQYDRIARLSMAFSEHIRYIFRKGTDMVTLEEEVNEASAYFRICSLRSNQPMLFEKDVDESLNGFLVPPLSIQTFIENTVKYGWVPGNLLLVRLTIRLMEKEDGRYINIRIEDNGPGYSEEILQELNRIGDGDDDGMVSQKVGIYNLISRTRLLYGDKAEFAFFNAAEGHAVSVLILPETQEGGTRIDENTGS